MSEKTEDGNVQTDAIHPAVLAVAGEKIHRWCAAIWSILPGEQQLVVGIRRLLEGTLLAHWMQPPAQYEPIDRFVNSFDLVFYDSPDSQLKKVLRQEGWRPVDIDATAAGEYEQFEVFVEEAEKYGKVIDSRPEALWRGEIIDPTGEAVDRVELGKEVSERLGDQVWGESPGLFSKVYCEQLEAVAGGEITPDRKGLGQVEISAMGGSTDREVIWWLDPMAFQAICDFTAVVIQTTTDLEVQWGVSPVDETSGLAPAPMVRVRGRGTAWTPIALGRDVVRRLCMPWGRTHEPGQLLSTLVERYERDSIQSKPS